MVTDAVDKYIAPPGRGWEFDEEVTRVFDNMLTRSIPGYATMRQLTNMYLRRHVNEFVNPVIVDIGASRGEAVASLVDNPSFSGSEFYLLEISEPMRSVLNARWSEVARVHVENFDIRYRHSELVEFRPSLVVSSLTTIFTPVAYRQAIVASIRKALAPRGGTFVWIEKILGSSANGDELLTREYYRFKSEGGYTQEEIDRKRLALEFSQTPLAAEWNEQILREAGFSTIQRYFQALNFAGWIATV